MTEQLNSALIHSPPVIDIGVNALKNVMNHVRLLGGSKVLIVSDPGVEKAGLVKEVQNLLEEGNISYVYFREVEPEPSIETVEKCTEVARRNGSDIIIAVGGGSPIDVAKSTAICCKTGESIRAHLGIDNIPGPGIPKIIIPTTAGSGSEASKAVVLTDQTNKTKTAAWSPFLVSDATIVDPTLHVTMSPNLTADTGADALSHAVEAYVCLKANGLTDFLALAAIQLIAENLVKAYANGDDLQARAKMAEASLLAGLAFSNSGLGAVHALAYPFTTMHGHPHGRGNAIVMAGVMKFNCIANIEKFRNITEALGEPLDGLSGFHAALRAADAVERTLNLVGIPTRISTYDIPEESLPEMAEQAVNAGARLLVNNPRKVTVDDALEIYRGIY